MTLPCPAEVPAELDAPALPPLSGQRPRQAAGGPLRATVRELRPEADVPPPGAPYVVSLHGADRLGIVAAVTRVLAAAGGNITDLSTRLVGPLYTLVAEVDLPTGGADAVGSELARAADELGVEVSMRPSDSDLL
jgi:glycine cleavage system transcriptional repressor